MTDHPLFKNLSQSNDISKPLAPNPTTKAKTLFIEFGLDEAFNADLNRQAKCILDAALSEYQKHQHVVGISYSANASQTKAIYKAWAEGQSGAEAINGANQAAVIHRLSELLYNTDDYKVLQNGVFKIVPISTMDGFDAKTSDKELRTCLEVARNVADNGCLFVWVNQGATSTHPYAIGGGVANVPKARHQFIMATLGQLISCV